MVLLKIHPAADEEAQRATQWYERQSAGLGEDFVDELEKALRNFAEAPERWPRVDERLRRYLLHRFPYAVVYRVGSESSEVLAVMHLHRRPDYWKGRMKS